VFFAIGAGLCVLAAVFVLWPVFTKQQRTGLSHDAVNRALYRARLEEVGTETQDPQIARELTQELGAVLLSEQHAVTVGPKTTAASVAGLRLSLLWPGLLVPALAVGVYLLVSDPYLPTLRGAEIVLAASDEDSAELLLWQQRLLQRVADVPGDHMSWYLLGHTHLKLDQFEQAAQAFGTTHALAGDDLNVLLYWLEARYLERRGYLDEFSQGLAAKLLAQHPDFPVVLEMLALDAFRREQYATAVKYLHKAQIASVDASSQAVFATAIQQVRNNMSTIPPGISVQVSSLYALPPQGTVFVIARPAGGGVPYAVTKRFASAVPFKVRLDDLVAMNEARPLTSAEAIEVVVRFSMAGTTQAHSADWEWRSKIISEITDIQLVAELSPPAQN
jgi:cytochrome c-type biogenesis protein CcmH